MAITFDVVKKPAVDFAVDNVRVAAGGGEAYEGNYEITPSEELQTLPTANRMLARNIVVAPIPHDLARSGVPSGSIWPDIS